MFAAMAVAQLAEVAFSADLCADPLMPYTQALQEIRPGHSAACRVAGAR